MIRNNKNKNVLGIDISQLLTNVGILSTIALFMWYSFFQPKVEELIYTKISEAKLYSQLDGIRMEEQLKSTDQRVNEILKKLDNMSELLLKLLEK